MKIPLPPKVRLVMYLVGTLVFGVVGLLSFFKVIDPEVASSVSAQLVSFLGLFGVTLAGTAAYNTNKQVNDGTFDQGPAPDPADAVVNGVNAVLAAKEAADRELARVQEAITGAVSDLPVLGPLAAQILDQLKK